MSASDITKAPKKIAKAAVTEVKETAKAVVAPATKSGSRNVFIGGLLSPIAAVGYSYVYGMIEQAIPLPSPLLHSLLKIAIPSISMVLVSKSKMPFGNLINGVLMGVVASQVVMVVINLITGKQMNMAKVAGKDKVLDVMDFMTASGAGRLMA